MNLDRAIALLERLPIKHRDTGLIVPFRPNPNQVTFFDHLKRQYAAIGMVRAIVLKARRVGISSASDGLLLPHALARPQAHAKIVAHRADTAEGLFRVPRDFARALPFPIGEIMSRKVIINHPSGHSIIDIATAGSVSGGRGLTLSALHLSEAAQFGGEDSFLSLLPAVQRGPGSMVFIESTAFGRVGIGKAFYDFWRNSVSGKTGYVPIFLSWLDDPGCVRDPDEARDAPSSDEERSLMSKPFNATRAQIAWWRYTLESECQGLIPKMLQENPHTPEVAFVSSGDPAFTESEIAYVRECACKPKTLATLELIDGRPKIVPARKAPLHVWEYPFVNHKYYIGADAASGVEEGDFAAYAILDGTTGQMVARFAERIFPEELARQLWLAGVLYNNAMINVELTGHLGRVIQRILRDDMRYWNLYGWKGKDDRLPGPQKPRSAGWETNTNTRRLLFDNFRTALRAGIRGEPGGIEVYDADLIEQMDLATLTESAASWEVCKGHDDILFACMLAVTTRVQYPPPRMLGRRSATPDPEQSDDKSKLPMTVQSFLNYSLGAHLKEVERLNKYGNRPKPLEGV